MTLTTYPDLEQGSEEWHAARRGIVTASTVHLLLTSKTKKAASNDDSRGLTLSLVAERITGYTDPTYQNFDMMRGVMDEPIARDLYSKHFAPVREYGFMVLDRTVGDPLHLGWSPDGLVGDDGAIEVKSRKQKQQLATILADEVPEADMAQLQAALLVSGREWIDYVSFSGGMPLYVKRVLPDVDYQKAIVTAVTGFEWAASEMQAKYSTATHGLPLTERIDHETAGITF